MKGILIVSKFWTKAFSSGKAEAVTIFPFILLRAKYLREDDILLNHERIHLRQALELLVIPFYTWYVVEFLIRFIKCKNFHAAYLNICFEREAYTHQNDLKYLSKRPFWNFLKFIVK